MDEHTKKGKPAGRGGVAGFRDEQCEFKAEPRPSQLADFDADYAFSSNAYADALVRRAAYRLIPGCSGVSRATKAEDRAGVDYWVVTRDRRLGLDLKLRRSDYGAARGASVDCVVELESSGTDGWLLKAGADLLLFACADTGRFELFAAKDLRIAVLLNLRRWVAAGQVREIVTKSQRHGRTWESRAVIVSADLIREAVDAMDEDHYAEAANDWGGGTHGAL